MLDSRDPGGDSAENAVKRKERIEATTRADRRGAKDSSRFFWRRSEKSVSRSSERGSRLGSPKC